MLLRELEQRGYRGSRTTLFAYSTQLRKASGLPLKKRAGVQSAPITDPTKRLPSSRGLTWLVLRKQDTLEAGAAARPKHAGHFVARSRHQRGLGVSWRRG